MRLLIKKVDGRLYLKLIGELDDRSSHDIRREMDNVIDRETFDALILDFSELQFMDSTGIGVIIGRYKRLKPLGKSIYVTNPSRQVDKIMNTCGLYQIIKKIG